ncbi:telethonin [Amia ocellicauda]|uniref:telethonin n=1 Tax=Amia ocellicauda TaxID=2972642 RepID=UPI003463AD84|nr:TELT protein [Amia calva]
MHSSNAKDNPCLFNAYCDVKENNELRKESYKSTWLDLVMERRPEEKTTLFENDMSRKETYEKKHIAYFLVQRHPAQKIKLGRLGEKMKEYQLPYKLPLPIFVPSKAVSSKERDRAPTPAELKGIMEFESALSSGLSRDRRELSEIKKEMPKVIQPNQLSFRASSLISPPNVPGQFEAVQRS